MQFTAQAWLVYRLTDSAAMVGLATFASQGPGLVLGPIAGAMADRHDKRAILVMTQLAALSAAALLGTLAVAGSIVAWQVIAIAFASGVARAIEVPTRQAFVPDLVGLPDLANAIALNSALFNVARLLGPALAGMLIPWVGEGWCFLGNAAAGVAVVLALLAIRIPVRAPRESAGTSIVREIRQGIGFARREPTIRVLLGFLLVTAAFGMPYGVLLPSFARRALAGGAETFSSLQVAIGGGALVAAVLLARRARVEGLERFVAWAGFGFGALLVVLSFARTPATAVMVLVPVGFCFVTQVASCNTLVQTICPAGLRGRVMSLYTTTMLGVFPISGLVAGSIADRVGEAPVLAAGGVVVALCALLVGPSLRRHAEASVAAGQRINSPAAPDTASLA